MCSRIICERGPSRRQTPTMKQRIERHEASPILGLLAWGGFFFVTRDVYQEAQQSGAIPNLYLKYKLGLAPMAMSP